MLSYYLNFFGEAKLPRNAYNDVNELQQLFAAYKTHLEKDERRFTTPSRANGCLARMNRFEQASLKKNIVIDLERIINRRDIEPSKKLIELKNFLNAPASQDENNICVSDTDNRLLSNGDVLKQHRSGALFLETLFHILTLVIYSKITKNSFAFWKSHGELVVDKITEITQDLLEEEISDENHFPSTESITISGEDFSIKNNFEGGLVGNPIQPEELLFPVMSPEIRTTKIPVITPMKKEPRSPVMSTQTKTTKTPVIAPIENSREKVSVKIDPPKTVYKDAPSTMFKPSEKQLSSVDMTFTVDFSPSMQEKLRQCFEKNSPHRNIKVDCTFGSRRLDQDEMAEVRKTMQDNPDYYFLITFEERAHLQAGIEDKKRQICDVFNIENSDRLIVIPYKECRDHTGFGNHHKELGSGFEEHIKHALEASNAQMKQQTM
jgi:hypothetical protein